MTDDSAMNERDYVVLLEQRDWEAILDRRARIGHSVELDAVPFRINLISAIAAMETRRQPVEVLGYAGAADLAATTRAERTLSWSLWLAAVKRSNPHLPDLARFVLSHESPDR